MVPLMEGVDFVRVLHTQGTFAWLGQRLKLSARRHYQIGPYRYTFICAAIDALYCIGLDNAALFRLYNRRMPGRHSARARRALPPVEQTLFSAFREMADTPNQAL